MSEMDIRGDEGPYDEEETEFSVETPEADAAEQEREIRQNADTLRHELPIDVDPGDATEQDRVVDLDDDEYR
ncbi:hypothetical protein OHA25_19130 [Nonomuraea sp. NBC_00507]|uniref:hypothetical protein n=1 Tax=Nonomuraea sp. NBC_00507 TaxID=2976002 RepID=UPI002E193755